MKIFFVTRISGNKSIFFFSETFLIEQKKHLSNIYSIKNSNIQFFYHRLVLWKKKSLYSSLPTSFALSIEFTKNQNQCMNIK